MHNLLCHELIDRSVRVNLQLPCPKHLQNILLHAFAATSCWVVLWQPLCGLCPGASEEAVAFVAQRKGFPSSSVSLHHHCYKIVPDDDASHDDAVVAAVKGEKMK